MSLCIIGKGAPQLYVYVYCIRHNPILRYTCPETKIWGFWIWIFIMHIRGLGSKGWWIHHLIHCEEWGVCFVSSFGKFFTWEFPQVLASSYINLSKWILYSHCVYLGFRGWQIRLFVHYEEWVGSFVPSLLSFSFESFCKFLRHHC